ncbi:hypothetical protein V5740_07390 [Croceibacterium sp. TMG7-5b_MA50]|uniref:hypothetical protein n=1 Tax=Croceibacterium sp. TMG7-5b_MA50 TaxID=3121290 RepID=UPI003221E78C
MIGLFAAAGLTLGAIVVSPQQPLEHRTQIEHASGAIDAEYRGIVTLDARQIGHPAPGGRAATLRCEWNADMAVEREARHANGSLLSRSIDGSKALTLTRAGWCNAHRSDVAQHFAERSDELRSRLVATAEADRAVLIAQVERQLAMAGE